MERARGRCAAAPAPAPLPLLLALLLAGAAAAPLPLHLRWLGAVVPPSAAGPALRDFFEGLPGELCRMGQEGLEALPPNIMDELCPLKPASRLGRVVPLTGLARLAEDEVIAKAAASPVTVGGALILLAADNATQAAAVQRRLCNVMIDPRAHCAGEAAAMLSSAASSNSNNSSSAGGGGARAVPGNFSGNVLGPLAYHLDAKDSVTEFLASKLLPLAMSPLGAALGALPDALCGLPADTLAGMPKQIKAQMCPQDVALVPVVAVFAMGRTGSSSLEAKLCDLFKRPAQACANGSYVVSPTMQSRLKQIARDSSAAVYSYEPVAPKLPKLSLPGVNLTARGEEQLEALAAWWANDTAPELRRYALSAMLPAQLAAPTASLLERLPDSICSLPRDSVAKLPVAFKAQVCGPLGLMLRQLAGGGSGSGSGSGGNSSGGGSASSIISGSPGGASYASTTWATALAEVAMAGAGGGEARGGGAKARVDAWVLRMCSAMYAPEVACVGSSGGGGRGTTAASAVADPAALALVGQRVQPVTVEVVSRALERMPPGQRKRLVEGVGKQLDVWAARARLLPKPAVKSLFGPFCPGGGGGNATVAAAAVGGGDAATLAPSGSSGSGGSVDLKTKVMIAAVDRIKPLHVLQALVGEEHANAAAAKVCDALLPTPQETLVGKMGAALRGVFKRLRPG